MTNFKKLQSRFELNVYPKRDVVLIRGENATVWDDQGREYIDCTAGHGVASVGHANPHVVQAIQEQLKKLVTCS